MQGNRRDKPIIEFDPEIEKILKKNRSRVKAQRALQFDQQEANSEEGASEKFSEEEIVEENSEEEIQDNMVDNANNQRRTLADYNNSTTASCGSSIVWPTVDANNFELKPALVQLDSLCLITETLELVFECMHWPSREKHLRIS
ncbi:hypothetical protein PIB30_071171 [Stylosanthes scabra]|uniref:Uncharacterized protein n=1 Tax=Stylosanthes scabra TaxID=79078 RepID=A0ABU6QPV2_9FABA|nr:hypothetical protein [Stylosanthes scabra]